MMIQPFCSEAPVEPATPRPVVLCVDDEDAILQSLRRLLRREPYDLLTTSEPQEALDWVRERHISIVIADQRMPAMNGTELLKSVRLQSPETGRAMLTAFPGLEAVEEERHEAVEKLIAKPWDDEELRLAIRRMLGHHSGGPARRTRDFRELVLPLDARHRSESELLSRVGRALRVPWTAFSGVTLLLENVWNMNGSVGQLMEGLAALVRETGVRTFVVDVSAYASTFLDVIQAGPLLTAYPPVSFVVPSRRVLIVSDREDTIEFFRVLLHAVHHDVVVARSGSDAIRCLDRARLDVAFADLDAPDVGEGFAMDRIACRSRVIALSVARPPAGLWLGKPFGTREVLEAVDTTP